jgi:hypothetical protein
MPPFWVSPYPASPWFPHLGKPRYYCSLSPTCIEELGGEPLFREPIHKPSNSTLDADKILIGDLLFWVAITDDGHPHASLSSSGITRLTQSLGSLRLPTFWCTARGSLAFTRTLFGLYNLLRAEPRCARPLLLANFTLRLGSTGPLKCLFLAALKRGLAAGTIPGRGLRQPSPLLGSLTSVFLLPLEPQSAYLFCQHLQVARVFYTGERVAVPTSGSYTRLRRLRIMPSSPCGASRRGGSPLLELPLESLSESPVNERSSDSISVLDFIFVPRVMGEISSPTSRAPLPGKAMLQLGGRLVSQMAPIETD